MIVLALDTCLDACAAAVWSDGRTLAARSEAMQRGHQERLGDLVQATLSEARLGTAPLDRIAVTVGPGSFTGVRVGLAFAKGLGLALERPLVGVGILEALAADEAGEVVAAAVAAPHAQVYLQLFSQGRALMSPDCLPLDTAAARLAELAAGRQLALVGSGAPELLPAAPSARVAERQTPDPSTVARLAAAASPPFQPVKPMYLRPPDARPSVA